MTLKLLQKAIDKVKAGELLVRAAAAEYCLPKSTLSDRIHGKHTRSEGRPQALSADDEQILVDRILVLARWGFPLTTNDLKYLVKSSLDRKGVRIARFVDNKPGERWCRKFRSRHKELSVRMAENVKPARAKVSPDVLQRFYDNLGTTIEGKLFGTQREINF